jgi:hypothetical protein
MAMSMVIANNFREYMLKHTKVNKCSLNHTNMKECRLNRITVKNAG